MKSTSESGVGLGEWPLMLFLHGRPRPLYVEPGNIKYDDFPNVAQEPTGMGKLRALAKLFTEASVQAVSCQGAPDEPWRTTMQSTPMASMVSACAGTHAAARTSDAISLVMGARLSAAGCT